MSVTSHDIELYIMSREEHEQCMSRLLVQSRDKSNTHTPLEASKHNKWAVQKMEIQTCGHLLQKMASLCPSSCARLCKIPVASTQPTSTGQCWIKLDHMVKLDHMAKLGPFSVWNWDTV